MQKKSDKNRELYKLSESQIADGPHGVRDRNAKLNKTSPPWRPFPPSASW